MNIHFVGIGGVSMSGLAHIAVSMGDRVSGSDSSANPSLDRLREEGVQIYQNHLEENISPDTDLVVFTSAVRSDNPELEKARQLGIPIMERAKFLSNIMDKYPYSVAISGTHGKTSTTSMTAVIFDQANTDPTVLVGGNLGMIGGNARIGSSDYFITEACEYVDNFLKFYPQISVILNIEHEHVDYFKSVEQMIHSFHTFASQTKEDGCIIANGDDPNVRIAMSNVPRKIIFFGYNDTNDAVIRDYSVNKEGLISFQVEIGEERLGPFHLQVHGKHNGYNATAAILSAWTLGLSKEQIQKGIEEYQGVDRRFQYKGTVENVKIFDDYAHHPTEVKATLAAAKDLEKRLLYVVFQPHTFSRTKELLRDFAGSFFDADVVIVADIYPSRERDTGLIHSKELVEAIHQAGKNALYLGTMEEIQVYLQNVLQPEDIVFTVGAGDIYKLGESLLKQ